MFYTYDIFDDAVRLREVIDNFFNDIPAQGNRRYDFPYVNLFEKDDTIEIKSIVPGVDSGNINVELVDSNLIISGERKSDYEDKPYIRKERTFGTFKKSIRLPYSVDRNNINAKLKDGILTITLSKSEEAKPKRIEIQ